MFAARAAENGLPVSKPSGDSAQFDYVVGHPGKFVAVQVKCTIAKQHNAKGYICNLKSNNNKYEAGSFDFVAAYAILEDTWYIVPEKAVRGMGAISLCSTMPKYEEYREAWHLLREAAGCEESQASGRNQAEDARVSERGDSSRAGSGADADGQEFLSELSGAGWAGTALSGGLYSRLQVRRHQAVKGVDVFSCSLGHKVAIFHAQRGLFAAKACAKRDSREWILNCLGWDFEVFRDKVCKSPGNMLKVCNHRT